MKLRTKQLKSVEKLKFIDVSGRRLQICYHADKALEYAETFPSKSSTVSVCRTATKLIDRNGWSQPALAMAGLLPCNGPWGCSCHFFALLEKSGMCEDGIGVTFCLSRCGVFIGWWWMLEALANLVHDRIVKAAAGSGKGFWVGRWVIKGNILNLADLSDDHLQSPILFL